MRVVIVDDESLARERLVRLLSRAPDVEVVGECADGRKALDAIRDSRPDVVFLDVQMPRMDGFALLDALPAGERPIIVFVTAFDEHAVRAFDAHALDYVLKPVDEERLHHTLARLRARRGEQRAAARYHAIAQAVQEGEAPGPRGAASSPAGDRLAVRNDGGRIIMVRIGSIDWIEARRNYVRLHLGTEWHLLRETMGRLERRLEPHGFARIHRSTIVNLDRVAEIQSRDTGELLVVLTNGLRLSLSRWFRERLEVRLAGR